MAVKYEKYWLSRIFSVQAIVSADYRQKQIKGGTKHIHNDAWELIMCMSGNVSVYNSEDSIPLEEGQVFLIQPGRSHCLTSYGENASVFIISFVCSNDNYLFTLQNRILQVQESSLEIVHSMIKELERSFVLQGNRLHLLHFIPSSTSPVGAEQMICCYLEQFLILLLRDATMEEGNAVTTGGFHQVFQSYLSDQVTSYIQDNLTAPLSVQRIADHFHYSRARLSSLYKEATGNSISDAISNARIQEAKKMLIKGGCSIANISESLGFSSPQYFSYKFAKLAGVSPTRYCKEHKKNTKKEKGEK